MNTKIRTTRADLLRALQIVSPLVKPGAMIHTLSMVQFSPLHGPHFSLYGASLESGAAVQVEGIYTGTARFAVDGKLFGDTIRVASAERIELIYSDQTLTITSGRSTFKMAATIDPEYPLHDMAGAVELMRIDAKVFGDALRIASTATSKDDLRPALTGVCIDTSKTVFNVIGTDAHKLHRIRFEHDSYTENKVVIPFGAVSVLTAACERYEMVQIKYVDRSLLFEFNGCQIWALLVRANYPDYDQVIPSENPIEVSIDRTELLESLRRLSLYSNKTTKAVSLRFEHEQLELIAMDLDMRSEAVETIPCDLFGDPIRVGMNVSMLIDMVRTVSTQRIRFRLSTPNRAVLIEPVGSMESYEHLGLIMPVTLGPA